MSLKKNFDIVSTTSNPTLFSTKDMYVMSCTKSGHNPLYAELSATEKRKPLARGQSCISSKTKQVSPASTSMLGIAAVIRMMIASTSRLGVKNFL